MFKEKSPYDSSSDSDGSQPDNRQSSLDSQKSAKAVEVDNEPYNIKETNQEQNIKYSPEESFNSKDFSGMLG